MRRLTLVIASLAAAPALAQPGVGSPDWTKLALVDGMVTVTDSAGTNTYIVQSHVSSQSLISPIAIESIVEASDTPLPPPCEPTPVRSGVLPPEAPTPSPTPPPAPCRP
jgi:hypothetical protein